MDFIKAQEQVRARVKELTVEAKNKLGIDMVVPSISFDLRGATAGRAWYTKHHVAFNKTLMLENWDEFDQTVIHEVAHLVTYHRAGFRREQPHGLLWKQTMMILGAAPKRCHTYDVSNAKIERTKYSYVCPACNKVWHVGAVRHKKMSIHGRTYSCPCNLPGNKVMFIGIKPRESARARSERCDASAAETLLKRFGNKKAAAEYIINTNTSMTRKQIINEFITKLDMTPAGAASYYWTLTK